MSLHLALSPLLVRVLSTVPIGETPSSDGGVPSLREKESDPGRAGAARPWNGKRSDVDRGRARQQGDAKMKPRRCRAHALALAAAVAASLVVCASVLPPGAGAAPPHGIPQVQVKTLRVPGAGLLAIAGAPARGSAAPENRAVAATLDAGMRFRAAGLMCDVPAADGVTISLRTSADGAAWSGWLDAPLQVADHGGRERAYTDPLWTGPARFLEVRARSGAGTPVELSGVSVVTIDPGDDAGLSDGLALSGRGASAARADAGEGSAPAIVTRAEWGADESLRSDSPSYAAIKMAFVHHTASGNAYTRAEAPALVRAIYAYHTRSLRWSDIGYNFLIDRFGTIYEGRYGGMASGVIGAQVGGFNTGSTGVSVIGTFTDEAPPTVAVTALERLLAWRLGIAGLDPKGRAQLTCGLTDKYEKGDTVTFPVIAGHRDANFTACPGDQLYALLPAVRTHVAERMAPPVVATLTADTGVISPNGDGVMDGADLAGSLSGPADWRLVVRDAAGKSVADWSGHGAKVTVTWKGTSGGGVVPDGEYTAELRASTLAGDSERAIATIAVDTSAPRLASAAAAPASFSPNGDGQKETATVTYRPAEACSVRVAVLDADGEVLRWLHGWREGAADRQSVTWDGRVVSRGNLDAAASGHYRFRIERRDAAGNTARQGVKIVLDRSLGFPTAAPGIFSPNGDSVRDATLLGFKLTRKATVTVRIAMDGKVVRTLSLGTLTAGKHTATWNGRARSGGAVASGRPVVTVEAVTALGRTSIAKDLVVDLTAPRLYATSGTSTTLGTSVRLSCKAIDSFSDRVDVSFVVTNASGRRISSGHPGLAATGQDLDVGWQPSARGTFTITWHATDIAGNSEAEPATTVVTVR